MKVAIYDTYVKKLDNKGTYHFDIVIEKDKFTNEEVITFGKQYLKSINAKYHDFSISECQFCHIETPTEEIINAINIKNYYIITLDVIPAQLPQNPTRTQLIQHIRATNAELRFKDFSTFTNETIWKLINTSM